MSAEAPTPHPEMPRRRLRVVKSNRTQILLFSILTLVLTAVVVWGGRTWLRAVPALSRSIPITIFRLLPDLLARLAGRTTRLSDGDAVAGACHRQAIGFYG